MFVKEDDPVEEVNTVVAFNRSTDGEKLIMQKSRHKDFDAYTKTQVKPKIIVRMNPNLLITRKAPKKSKRVEGSLRARL